MKKVKGLRKRIVAMLMSGMLAVGSVPGVVLASENQTDIGRNSEIAAEVPEGADLEEVPEGADLKEVPEETASEDLPAEEYSEDTVVQDEETVTTYTITLDANGGYFESEWDDTLGETVEQAEVVEKRIPVGGTVAAFPVCADQDGQTMLFAGWSLERDGELVTTGDEEYAPVDNCTLYAMWQKDETTSSVDVDDASQGYTDSQYVENADENSEQTDSGHESAESGIAEDAEAEAGEDGAIEESESEIPDQNVDTGNKEGFENNTVGADDNSFSEESKNAEQSEDTVLLDESVPEVLEGEKPAAEEISAAGESGQFKYDIEDDKAMIRGRVPDVYYDEHGDYDHEDNLAVVHLTIPEEINGYPVTYIEGFSDCENLQSVTLPESLEEIGMKAFEGCLHLKQITFPSTLKRVCAGAFKNTGLTSVTIPAGTQTWEYVADNNYLPGVFDGCDSLSTITFEEGMTDISRGWCWGCTGLQNIQFPSTVKTIGYRAFADCSRLTSVVIPEGVTFIDSSAFENCVSLSSVSLASTLERIENGAFKNTGLTSVRIPAGCDSGQYTAYYRNLPYYPGVFEDCGTLSEVWFEDGTETVTRGWFFRCPGLETVHLPSTVKGIDFRAFADCENLKDVELPEGLEYIDEQVFIGCSSLAGVDLPSSLDYVGEGAFAETGLTEVTIPAGADTDRYHGYDIGVFEDCDKLRTVRFEEGMTRIGQGWCTGCTGLETIVFPSTLTEIFHAFEYCKNLSAINIPEGVKTIGNCSFKGCEKLTSVNLPSTLECIDWHAFEDCTSLKAITVPAAVSEVNDYAFAGCTSLEIFRSGGKLERLWDSAFERCTGLKEIHLPEKLSLIGQSAFKDCVALADIYYGGTKEGWNKIDIREDNAPLSAAKLHPAKVIYKVTFNANGGTVKSGSKTVKTLSKNYSSKTAIGTLPTPARSSYCFLGWYSAKSSGNKISANTKVTKTVTYYAHWASAEIGNVKVKVGNCTWDGKPQQPALTVTLSGVTLKKGTDYTVTCSNNKEPGKGKAVIKGKGRFAKSKKTKTVYFTIGKANQVISPKYASYTYSKNGKKITQKTTVKNAVLTFSSNLKGTKITLNTAVKENAKLTYSSSQKGIPVKDKSKGVFLLSSPTEATITIKAAATKHYNAATKKVKIILKADKQTLSLDSPYLTKSGSEYVLKRDVSDELLHVKRGGNVGYTCLIELSGKNNEVWIGKGNLLYAKGEGGFKVRVTTKATSVYPEMTKVFTIRKILKSGLPVNGNNFLYRQIDDNTISLQKYVGSAKDVTIPVSLKIHGKDKNLKQVASSAFLESNVRSVLFSDVSGGKGVRTIGTGAFAYCKGLTTVRLPEGLTTIGNNAFNGCGNLKTVLFANSVNRIGSSTFGDCTSLSGPLFLPLKLKTVGESAFKGCRGITSVMMFPDLTAVDKNAFSGCSGIQDVLFAGPVYRWNNIKFGSGNEPVTGKNRIHLNAGAPVSTYEVLTDIKEKTNQLYKDTPEYLNNEGYERLDKNLEDYLLQIMIDHTDNEIVISAIKSILQGGIIEPSIVAIIDAGINDPDTSWAEQDLNKALALELLRDCQDAGSWTTINKDMLSHFEKAREIAGKFKGLGKGIINDEEKRDLFAELICQEFENLKEEEVSKALKSICDYWKLNEDVIADVESATGQAFDAIEFITTYIEIKEYYREAIEIMINVVPADTGLYDGVCQLKDLIDSPLDEYIEHIMKKECITMIVKAVQEGFDKSALSWVSLSVKIIGFLINSPTIDEYNRGWISINTTIRLHQALSEMNDSIIGASAVDRIASVRDHTFLAELYFASFRKSFSYVGNTINDSTYINRIQKRYQGAWNYNAYIRSSLENLAEAQ